MELYVKLYKRYGPYHMVAVLFTFIPENPIEKPKKSRVSAGNHFSDFVLYLTQQEKLLKEKNP